MSERGQAQADEAAIFAAYARLREREASAVTETKRARRVRVRRHVVPPDDPSAAAQERALAVLALLSGGMIMAHAVGDSRLGTRIARAVVNAVAKVGTPDDGFASDRHGKRKNE